MKRFNCMCAFSLLFAAMSLTSCSERIDAGSEGILVNSMVQTKAWTM